MTPRTHFLGSFNFFSHGKKVQKGCHRVTRVTQDAPKPATSGESGELLPILATLAAHPSGAIVADLAAELGADPRHVERLLFGLKRQGLAKTERLGDPPITHWLAL